MTNSDYIKRIVSRVSKIMYENPTLFAIVGDINISAKHYKIAEKDLEFYVRQTIESKIGLYFVVSRYVSLIDSVRYGFNNYNGKYEYLMEETEKAMIRSILMEYADMFPGKEDREKFNNIEI